MNTCVNFTPFQYLIYYFASILGLAPFAVKNTVIRPLGFLPKAYAVFLLLLNASLIFYTLNRPASEVREDSTVSRFVFVMLLTLYAMNLCFTMLTFAFKTDKLIEIWNGITAISDELKKLGVDLNCGISLKKFGVKIILANGVFILIIMSVKIVYRDNIPNVWIALRISSIQHHNAIAIFSGTIICIRELFESLNERLQDAVQRSCNLPSSDDQHGSSTAYGVVRNRGIADLTPRRITTEPVGVQLRVEDVQKIAKLHEEICDLVESVTNCFAVSVLFNIVHNFNNLLSDCYSVYTDIFLSREIFGNTDADVAYFVSLMTWMFIALMESLLIAHACTSMSRVGNATKSLLHEVWNKFYPEELRDELFKFSLHILHKPIAVSAFDFFDLGYSYVIKILFALVAYLIIMIQFDTPGRRNPGT